MTESDARELLKILIHFNGEGRAASEMYQASQQLIEMNNLTVPGLIYEFAPKCEDMLEKCMWKGTQVRCDTTFQSTLTLKGICCSFNYEGLRQRMVDTQT